MTSFYLYDIIFLVVFSFIVGIFLYSRRKNLQRQGILYLYKTKLGIKFIDWTAMKFPRTLGVLQYIVVVSGYFLMAAMIWLLGRFGYFYLTSPVAAEAIKIPVVMPLIPYLPEIFNLDFLPPFYFTYWIVILAIAAIPHEFAHGIFARFNKIKILSTGFGFLGPFLAAFVEPDEKHMEKTGKFAQLSVLAAGTFANIIFTIIFAGLFWLFFVSSFTPAGVIFSTYAMQAVNISEVNGINGNNLFDIGEIQDLPEGWIELNLDDGKNAYILKRNAIVILEENLEIFPAVADSPAFRANLSGAITEFNGVKIDSYEKLADEIDKYKPGDAIIIKTVQGDRSIKEFNVELDENEGNAFLGIGVSYIENKGLLGGVYSLAAKIKSPIIYYESDFGNFGWFIYHMLWWTILICISVALVNMLPLGIFDGGRFFYLTVLAITGSKKISERAFKISTYIFLGLIAAMMVKWALIFV